MRNAAHYGPQCNLQSAHSCNGRQADTPHTVVQGLRLSCDIRVGLLLGLEAPVMSPAGIVFVLFPWFEMHVCLEGIKKQGYVELLVAAGVLGLAKEQQLLFSSAFSLAQMPL